MASGGGSSGASPPWDVVVVGAGIMGSSSAYHCARRGLRVLLLEQFHLLHRRGSSHGESRIIRRTYPEDWYTEMMPKAYHLWAEAAEDAGYSPLTITGSLDFGKGDQTDLRELMDAAARHQVPHEVLSVDELRGRFPAMDFPQGTVGVYCAEGGVVNATKACAMFQQLAVKWGASLLDRTSVLGVRLEGSIADTSKDEQGSSTDTSEVLVVETSNGAFRCKACVLACGTWTSPLAKSISGVDLPLQPIHVHVAYWKVRDEWQAELDGEKGFPVLLHYADEDLVYGMPILEFPGLVKISSHTGQPCDPDNRPLGPSPRSPAMQRWVRKWFGERADLEPALVEACTYTNTPDQDFILDILPLTNGLVGPVGDASRDAGTVGDASTDAGTVGDASTDAGTVGDASRDSGSEADASGHGETAGDASRGAGTVGDVSGVAGTVGDVSRDTGTVGDVSRDAGTVGDVRGDAGTVGDASRDTGTVGDFSGDVGTVGGASREGTQATGEGQKPRVVVAAGFSGHGFKFGPLIGSVVADLVEFGSSSLVPMEKFSIERFAGGRTGNPRASGPQVRILANL